MASTAISPGEIVATADRRVVLYDVSWLQFETMLQWRGDAPAPRYAYLKGTLEIMSPSSEHERIKSWLGRLVEAYAMEIGLELSSYGSWSLKRAELEKGLEPDECYIFGPGEKDKPDLAIEVIWTHGGIDKLEIYRGLEVYEVWRVVDGHIDVHLLRDGVYVRQPRSAAFPELDLELVMRLLGERSMTRAIMALRDSLRG